MCALGLTPQSVHVFGGYKVQARTRETADQLIADCKAVVDAGAAILLLECVPAQVGKEISELFPNTPVIGNWCWCRNGCSESWFNKICSGLYV